jgi:hypothetical protein
VVVGIGEPLPEAIGGAGQGDVALVAARRIYLTAGFHLVEEERHHSFGVDLIGQSYVLDLDPD